MDKNELTKIIVIAGTNASGKSALGIELEKNTMARSYRRIPDKFIRDLIYAAGR